MPPWALENFDGHFYTVFWHWSHRPNGQSVKLRERSADLFPFSEKLNCNTFVHTNSGSVEVIQLFCKLKKRFFVLLGMSIINHGICIPSFFCHTQGSHPYQSLSYTSGDTAADSPAHVSRVGLPAKDSPRKESLLSNLTGSFRSLHNLLEGMPQRNEPSATTAAKSSSLTRTGTHASTTAANYSMWKTGDNRIHSVKVIFASRLTSTV